MVPPVARMTILGKFLSEAADSRPLSKHRSMTTNRENLSFGFIDNSLRAQPTKSSHSYSRAPLPDPRPHSRSVGLKTLGPKSRQNHCQCFRSRRLHVAEHVIEFEFTPFEATYLMEGKDIHAFDISEASGEARNLGNVVGVIRRTWY